MKELNFEIRIPEEVKNSVIQEEFFYLKQNGVEEKVKLHDYLKVYEVPYLYEHVYGILQKKSHTFLSSLLIERVTQAGKNIEDLVVLEVGAGSGMLGKALANLGVKSIVGIDIVPKAAEAAEKLYPGVYENYYIENLIDLSKTTQEALTSRGFNCIVCGSALGFNHIPATAWVKAFDMISPNSWVAFNVQKDRWEDKSENSFLAWHPWVDEKNIFEITETHDYQERIYMDGRPLYYVAIIGKKLDNISQI